MNQMPSIAFRAALALAALAPATVRAGAPPAGPDFGTPVPLAAACEPVQKELGLSDDQVRTLRSLHQRLADSAAAAPEVKKEMADVLKPEQLRRLAEISRQVRGGAALLDPDVADALNLTAAQRERLADGWRDEVRKLRDALSRIRFKSERDRTAYVAKHVREAGARMLATLTDNQKGAYRRLQGEPFDVSKVVPD